jgi:hypothetical protein
MGQDNEVLLKLLLKGMNPAEAQRVASQTHQALEAELRASMGRQVAAHRQAAEATSKEAKKTADAAIKESTRMTQQLITAMKEAEKQHKTSWRRMAEDLENITVVASGAWAVITGGAGRLKAFSEEVVRTTNVFSSLKGSIDEARDAVEGTVTDMDLILARNRALEMDLELTDDQFANVAAQADRYADSLGTNVKEALDKVITGLATGQQRALRNAGVVIDADKAYKAFAASIGTTGDKLSDLGQRMAIQNAALEQMAKKAKAAEEGIKGPANMALLLEQGLTASTNAWDRFVNEVGMWEPPAGVVSFLKDLVSGPGTINAQLAELRAAESKVRAMMASSRAARAQAERAANGGLPEGVTKKDLVTTDKNKKPITYVSPSTVTGTDRLFFAQQQRAQDELDRIRAESEEGQLDRLMADAAGGLGDGDITNRIEQMDREMKDTIERVGGPGIMSQLLWGPDGPDQTYAQMDDFGKAVTDAMGLVGDTTRAMVEAQGAAFASAIAGQKGFKLAALDAARAVIQGLVARASVEAVMKTAEGFSKLSNPITAPLAAADFTSAALFASVAGVAAAASVGLSYAPGGARAGGGKAGSTPTASSSQTFGSAPTSSSRTRDREVAPVNLYINVMPGGEAEAGRSVIKALEAYRAQSGRDIVQILSAA